MRGFGGKATTSDYLQLDVRYLQRNGYLRPGQRSSLHWSRNKEPCGWIEIFAQFDRINLMYRHRRSGDEWEHENYSVLLERTRCHFGGERTWFRCPIRGCGRRVAVLYSGGIFACRLCHNLGYDSQREAGYERAIHRAQAIRRKLGGTGSLGEPFPARPRRMHRRTYWRLFEAAERAQQHFWPPWLMKRLRTRNA